MSQGLIEFTNTDGGLASGASFTTKNFTIQLGGTKNRYVTATRKNEGRYPGYKIQKDVETGAISCSGGICSSLGITETGFVSSHS